MVSAACRELLLDAQRFSATFGGGLFNHLPMALLALDRLGADDVRLRAFFTTYSKHLRPKSDAETKLAETMRGQRAADVVPQLSAGVASQAFHGLIRVAYAVDSGVDADIPDALAAWKGGFSELPDRGTERFATFADAFAAVAADERLPRNVDGRSIDARIARVIALPAFADYLGTIAHVALPDMASTSARVYASSADFVALHMVTGCHAMRVLAPFLGPRALHVFATAILAAHVAIGRPPLASSITPVLPSDAQLAARAVPGGDDHDLKMVYSCLREEAEYRTGWHRFAAAVRLADDGQER